MTLCSRCVQVVRKEEPMFRISGEEPTVDYHSAFKDLRESAKSCELCKAILESATHDNDQSLEDEADLERAFRGLKLRVEVNHFLCSPYSSHPPSSNDISAWGLRAYWVREEMSTRLILRKELGKLLPAPDRKKENINFPGLACPARSYRRLRRHQRKAHLDQLPAGCRGGPAANHFDLAEGVRRPAHFSMLSRRRGEAPPPAHPLHRRRGGRRVRRAAAGHLGWLPRALHDPLSEAINLDTLPRTYRDAVSITRALGIRYIWIDSLCIIQDDVNDWERESANMASIYRNAYLNLAATSALDSDGGCMHTPRPTTGFQIDPPPRWSSWGRFGAGPAPGEAADAEQATPALVRASGSVRNLEKAALNTRAWVLQEVCLSRRTIHFAQDQMYWFCAEREASEDGSHVHTPRYAGPPRAPLLGPPHWLTGQKDNVTRGSVYTMWWTLVEDYSSRALTKASDKMAALAGLTQFFREKLSEDEPVAGMWKAELVDSLCWTCNPFHGGGSRRESLGLGSGPPSWSWISIDGPIKRNCCRMSNELPHKRTEKELVIESVDVGWSGRPLTSSMQGGRLVGRGMLVELDFRLEEEHVHHCAAADTGNKGQMILYQGESRVVGRFKFDWRASVSSGAVRCLAVTQKQVTLNFCPPQDTVYFWFHVLILEPTGREDGEFRRIGAGKVWADSGVFDQVQPLVVQIV